MNEKLLKKVGMMVAKFKNKKKEEALVETDAQNVATNENNAMLPVRCVAWCFLPGISHIGQTGLLQCVLEDDHEEEEHRIQVGILSPPAGNFTITWTVGTPE